MEEQPSNLISVTAEQHLTMRQADSTPDKKPQSRWRKRNPDDHKKEKNKRRRNAGRPYETTKGNFIPPRSIGNECKCKKKCRSLLLGTELQLFHSFWDLGSYDLQQVYLGSRIHVERAKRHYKSRTKHITNSPKRKVTYKYSVDISGRQIFVCKVEFLAVHGLQFSAKRVEILSRKLKNSVNILNSDGRGKPKHHKRVDDISLNMVREHINIIPKYVSHYSREVNPNKVYLDCDMTISGLHRKYVEWINKKNDESRTENAVSGIEVLDKSELVDAPSIIRTNVNGAKRRPATEKYEDVSEDKYRRIFCTEYNIGFKLPRSDTCKTCDSINIKLAANKDDAAVVAQLKAELEIHHIAAKKMQDDLKKFIERAKTSGDFDVFIFDLQQALLTPTLTVGDAFYLRKALTYNFGIHDGKTGKGSMFMWQ